MDVNLIEKLKWAQLENKKQRMFKRSQTQIITLIETRSPSNKRQDKFCDLEVAITTILIKLEGNKRNLKASGTSAEM